MLFFFMLLHYARIYSLSFRIYRTIKFNTINLLEDTQHRYYNTIIIFMLILYVRSTKMFIEK